MQRGQAIYKFERHMYLEHWDKLSSHQAFSFY